MFQYLTSKHAPDSRPHRAPCTVCYGERLFGMSEETRGQAHPAGLCFQSVWTHPNCLERQAGLAGQRDQETALLLWGAFPSSGGFLHAAWEQGEPCHSLGTSIVLTAEPYLNRYAGCHQNTNKKREERHVPSHFIPANMTQLEHFSCLMPHIPGSCSIPTATSVAHTNLPKSTSPKWSYRCWNIVCGTLGHKNNYADDGQPTRVMC